MRDLLIIAAAMALGTGLVAGSAPAQTPPAAAPGVVLAPGPGHDTMVRVCKGCHAPEIAAQQRLTPAGWKELVETMANNGAVATDAELAEITDYLAKSYPADAK